MGPDPIQQAPFQNIRLQRLPTLGGWWETQKKWGRVEAGGDKNKSSAHSEEGNEEKARGQD